jgi:hypothetical protein
MGADASNYRAQKLKLVTGGGAVAQHDLAITTDTAEILKARFYLDSLYAVQSPSGGAFIGGCMVGSFNYNMHNPARVGALRWRDAVGVQAGYADAGLNTKGIVIGEIVVLNREFTNVQLKASFKSAYLVFTDAAGIQTRTWNDTINNWGGWSSGANSGNAAAGLQFDRVIGDAFGNIDASIKAHGYQVRAFITNSEGTYIGPTSLPIFLTGILTQVRKGFWSGQVMTFYRDNQDITAADAGGGSGFGYTSLYTDESLTLLYMPQGLEKFYTAQYDWFIYGYRQDLDTWVVTTLGHDGAPPDPVSPPKYAWTSFHASSQDLAEQRTLDGNNNSVDWYMNNTYQTAHKNFSGTYPNWNFGTLADQGYYVTGNRVRIERVMYVDGSGIATDVDPINQ